MTEDHASELSRIEQNLEHLAAQRKKFQQQLMEVEAAKEEIRDAKEAYKIIGNLMVKRTAQKTREELEEKQATLKVRIESIEKQEEKFHEKTKELQEKILKKVKK